MPDTCKIKVVQLQSICNLLFSVCLDTCSKRKTYRNTSSIVNRSITQCFAHVSGIFFTQLSMTVPITPTRLTNSYTLRLSHVHSVIISQHELIFLILYNYFNNMATFYQLRLIRCSTILQQILQIFSLISSAYIYSKNFYDNRIYVFLYYLLDVIDTMANNVNYLISRSSRRSSLKFQTCRPIVSSSNNK